MNNRIFIREIHFRSLLWQVARRWRGILIFALIAAVLSAGYKYYRNQSVISGNGEQEKTYQEELGQYNDEIETYEAAADEIDDGIAEKEEYLRNSAYMKIDPNHMVMASADVVITSDDVTQNPQNVENLTNGLNRIVGAYQGFITGGIDYTDLAKEMNTEPSYIWELVGVTADYYGNRLNINVRHYDKAKAGKILDYVLDALEEKEAEYEKKFGTFEINVINESTDTVVYSNLFSWMDSRLNELSNLQSQKETVSTKLEQLDGSKPKDTAQVGRFTRVPVFAGIGFIGGLILAILFSGICLILGNRVLSAEEFNHQFNLRRLAVFPAPGRKKSKPDLWVDHVFGPEEEAASDGEREILLKKNIVRFSSGNGGFLITGQVEREKRSELVEIIKKITGTDEVHFVSGFSTDPEAIIALEDVQDVIIAGEVGITQYRRVEADIQVLLNWDKNIVGSIVISR